MKQTKGRKSMKKVKAGKKMPTIEKHYYHHYCSGCFFCQPPKEKGLRLKDLEDIQNELEKDTCPKCRHFGQCACEESPKEEGASGSRQIEIKGVTATLGKTDIKEDGFWPESEAEYAMKQEKKESWREELAAIWNDSDTRNYKNGHPYDRLYYFIKHLLEQAKKEAKREVLEELYNKVKTKHVIAKTAYPSDSWDAGVHDTLFSIEKIIVKKFEEILGEEL